MARALPQAVKGGFKAQREAAHRANAGSRAAWNSLFVRADTVRHRLSPAPLQHFALGRCVEAQQRHCQHCCQQPLNCWLPLAASGSSFRSADASKPGKQGQTNAP
jgi:hypothetical protein